MSHFYTLFLILPTADDAALLAAAAAEDAKIREYTHAVTTELDDDDYCVGMPKIDLIITYDATDHTSLVVYNDMKRTWLKPELGQTQEAQKLEYYQAMRDKINRRFNVKLVERTKLIFEKLPDAKKYPSFSLRSAKAIDWIYCGDLGRTTTHALRYFHWLSLDSSIPYRSGRRSTMLKERQNIYYAEALRQDKMDEQFCEEHWIPRNSNSLEHNLMDSARVFYDDTIYWIKQAEDKPINLYIVREIEIERNPYLDLCGSKPDNEFLQYNLETLEEPVRYR